MKVKEVLELTQTTKISDIAKQHLTIGEKYARTALKTAGCYSLQGKRGWFYEGDPHVLEKSIYDFAPTPPLRTRGEGSNEKINKPLKKKLNNSTEKTSNTTLKDDLEKQKIESLSTLLNEKTNIDENKNLNSNSNYTNVLRKRSSFDIDLQLLKQAKIQAIVEDRNLYELVEDALRDYLRKVKSN